MENETLLTVCDENNFDCNGRPMFTFERNEDGKFGILTFSLGYKTEYNIEKKFLRICLLDVKTVHIYEMDYNNEKLEDPEWAEFKITFDLNESAATLKDYDEITVAFTCWHEKCKCYHEYHDYVIEKITVLSPANEKAPSTKITKVFHLLTDDPDKELIKDDIQKPLTLTEKLCEVMDTQLAEKKGQFIPIGEFYEDIMTKLANYSLNDQVYEETNEAKSAEA